MHILRLHFLWTFAAFFVVMFFLLNIPPAHAELLEDCIEKVNIETQECEQSSVMIYNQCRDEGGSLSECKEPKRTGLAKCTTEKLTALNRCNSEDSKDSDGICQYGIDAVYGGCLNFDGSSTLNVTVQCNGTVNSSGECVLTQTKTATTSGDVSIAVQYQSIQNQGIIFGNICTSRAAQCECRDLGNCSLDDVLQVVVNISVLILGLSGSLVLLMFVYGGFLWLTSHGNETMVTEGKKTMTGALVGLLIVFGSYAAITSFISVLKSGEVPVSSETEASPNLIEVLKEDALTGAAGSSAAPGTGVTKPKDTDGSSSSSSSSSSDSSLQGLADAAGGALSGVIN